MIELTIPGSFPAAVLDRCSRFLSWFILGSDQRYYLIIEMNGNQKGSFRLLKRPFGPQESAF
jgi:hypothetical protein